MTLIYCIEDDESIRELVVYALESSGFEAQGFRSSIEDFSQCQLLILDLMLPGEDGISILKRIRKDPLTRDLPIIILTAKTDELSKVKALDLGADDYMDKPFSIMELISRVKALLRRTQKNQDFLAYDGLTLYKDRHQVYLLDQEIQLTNKEFLLLEYFLENQGLVLSREQILEEVWGYDFQGESRTIDVHVRSLRMKLRSKSDLIKTVINVGYKLGD